MPRRVSHENRRLELAEAVWRVIERDGFEALSMRRIAEEAAWSLGAVAHYFPNKDALLTFAYELAMQREGDRYRGQSQPFSGLAALGAAARAAVCLTPDAYTSSLIWLAFLPRATCREDLRMIQKREQTDFRECLAAFIEGGIEQNTPGRELDCGLEATLLASFLDGLTLQALLEPEEYTPERQVQLLDAYLEGRGLSASRASPVHDRSAERDDSST